VMAPTRIIAGRDYRRPQLPGPVCRLGFLDTFRTSCLTPSAEFVALCDMLKLTDPLGACVRDYQLGRKITPQSSADYGEKSRRDSTSRIFRRLVSPLARSRESAGKVASSLAIR
jgi:hypothetical protein